MGVEHGSCPSDCAFCASPTVEVVKKALAALDAGRLDIAQDLLKSFLAGQGKAVGEEHK